MSLGVYAFIRVCECVRSRHRHGPVAPWLRHWFACVSTCVCIRVLICACVRAYGRACVRVGACACERVRL